MFKQNITFIIFLTFLLGNVNAQEINQLDANGKRHGVWKKNFDGTNQLRYEGQFDHGKEVGLFKFYKLIKKKSVLTATKSFDENTNIADVTFFASNGKEISKGKMNGKVYIGEWQYFHNKNGGLMTKEFYNDNGQLHGEKLVFYDNGKIAEQINYVNGKKEGVSTWLSLKGVKLKEFMYENDQLHGVSKYYSGNGDLLVEGRYKRDKKTGVWKYYKNGKLVDEKDFTYVSKNPKKQ